jgi:hypothetical protein
LFFVEAIDKYFSFTFLLSFLGSSRLPRLSSEPVNDGTVVENLGVAKKRRPVGIRHISRCSHSKHLKFTRQPRADAGRDAVVRPHVEVEIPVANSRTRR